VDSSARSAFPGVVGAAAINRAALLLAPVVRSTPLVRCERLSVSTGAPVLLKREDTQVVRSYKVRGAYNLIASLPEDARAKGVVCSSAGNHAQGVAFSCAALGIPGHVFLPATTPRQKRERIRAIGGDAVEILVRGSTYDETSAIAIGEAASSGATYVHPFDDRRLEHGRVRTGAHTTDSLLGRRASTPASAPALATTSPASRGASRAQRRVPFRTPRRR
jgi:threonine dehydratase